MRNKLGQLLTMFLLVSAAQAALADAPTVAAVVDSQVYGANLCPGMFAAVFGTNFGSTASQDAVTVGGQTALVAAVTPTQLSIEIPMGLTAGATTLTVNVGGVPSAPFALTLTEYAPVIGTLNNVVGGPAWAFSAAGAQITQAAPAKPGDAVLVYVLGLGPTSPPTPTGVSPSTNSTAAPVTLTLNGVSAKVAFAGIPQGLTDGIYQINFTVPAGLQGDQTMIVSVGGVSSPAAAFSVFGVTSIVSNASFASPGVISPGEIATVNVDGLPQTNIITGFPSTNFSGVSVSFNGRSAPLFHVNGTSNSIDLVVPDELPVGPVTIEVTMPSGTSPAFSATVAAATPGLYRIADPQTKGRENIIAQFAGTVWLALPASMATEFGLPGGCGITITNVATPCGQPAAVGSYLAIYTTGLGATFPSGNSSMPVLATGTVAPVDGSVLYETPTLPIVTVGGVPATVLFSGIVPGLAGLYVVDIQVPAGVTPGDDVPVTISMTGSSSDTATVSVQPNQ